MIKLAENMHYFSDFPTTATPKTKNLVVQLPFFSYLPSHNPNASQLVFINVSQPHQKACPVLARQSEKGLEILAFRHPFAGTQLIAESVEEDQNPENIAASALLKESGISPKGAPINLGTSNGIVQGESWQFILFQCPPLATLREIGPPPSFALCDLQHLN